MSWDVVIFDRSIAIEKSFLTTSLVMFHRLVGLLTDLATILSSQYFLQYLRCLKF